MSFIQKKIEEISLIDTEDELSSCKDDYDNEKEALDSVLLMISNNSNISGVETWAQKLTAYVSAMMILAKIGEDGGKFNSMLNDIKRMKKGIESIKNQNMNGVVLSTKEERNSRKMKEDVQKYISQGLQTLISNSSSSGLISSLLSKFGSGNFQ